MARPLVADLVLAPERFPRAGAAPRNRLADAAASSARALPRGMLRHRRRARERAAHVAPVRRRPTRPLRLHAASSLDAAVSAQMLLGEHLLLELLSKCAGDHWRAVGRRGSARPACPTRRWRGRASFCRAVPLRARLPTRDAASAAWSGLSTTSSHRWPMSGWTPAPRHEVDRDASRLCKRSFRASPRRRPYRRPMLPSAERRLLARACTSTPPSSSASTEACS